MDEWFIEFQVDANSVREIIKFKVDLDSESEEEVSEFHRKIRLMYATLKKNCYYVGVGRRIWDVVYSDLG